DRVVLRGLVEALDLEQREQLVHPGRHGELLGGDAVHSALREQFAEPVLNGLPVALHLLLRLHLLAEEVRSDLRRLRAQLGLERVREAVRRVGRKHDRAHAGGGAATRRCGRHARLPDAALARVEDGPRSHRGSKTYLLTVTCPVSWVRWL